MTEQTGQPCGCPDCPQRLASDRALTIVTVAAALLLVAALLLSIYWQKHNGHD